MCRYFVLAILMGVVSSSAFEAPLAASGVDHILLQRSSSRNGNCATCSSCEAVPGNDAWATDESCAQCANDGYRWWPCNQPSACQCAGSAHAGAPATPAPSPT